MASQHLPLQHRYAMIVLTAVVILGLILCYFIAIPFLSALVWSLTLAVLFAPVERRLRSVIKFSGLSVPLTLALAVITFVGPIALVSGALGTEIGNGVNLIKGMFSPESWFAFARKHPGLSPSIHWVAGNLELPQLLQSLTAQLGLWSASVVKGSVAGIANLLLTFYFLFYLLRDKEQLLAAIGRLVPLTAEEFRMLSGRIVQTIFASVYGTAAVATMQGILGGLMFWWLDLPSPLFWGVIMGILAVVPFLGAFVVWVPASIALALDGQLLSAAMLALWGTIVVGLVDNVIYPILVGKQLAMHSMLSFIAIIGGLFLFGAHGLVLGPLIVAGSQTLLEILRSRLDLDQAHSPAID